MNLWYLGAYSEISIQYKDDIQIKKSDFKTANNADCRNFYIPNTKLKVSNCR